MTTVREFFEERLPQAVARQPQRARELAGIFVITVSGDGGGTWTIDGKNDPPAVSAGVSAGADCTLALAADDFLALLKEPHLGMQLFFQGRLTVEGNPLLATRLQDLLALAG